MVGLLLTRFRSAEQQRGVSAGSNILHGPAARSRQDRCEAPHPERNLQPRAQPESTEPVSAPRSEVRGHLAGMWAELLQEACSPAPAADANWVLTG